MSERDVPLTDTHIYVTSCYASQSDHSLLRRSAVMSEKELTSDQNLNKSPPIEDMLRTLNTRDEGHYGHTKSEELMKVVSSEALQGFHCGKERHLMEI